MMAGAKPKTAAAGNADNDQFHSDTGTASGETAELGGQVQPETQLREDDGNRSFANPALDPGPVQHAGRIVRRDPDAQTMREGKGTISSLNDPVKINRRGKYGPHDSADVMQEHDMAPDLVGNAGASDVYNKERGEGLTDMAVKRANEPRDIAPTKD